MKRTEPSSTMQSTTLPKEFYLLEQPSAEHYRRVWSDDDIAAMNQRSARRRMEAIAALGPRWVGYIANRPDEEGYEVDAAGKFKG